MSRIKTIPISSELHRRLQDLADKHSSSLESALDYALSVAERQDFWDQMRSAHEQNQGFLPADVEAWDETLSDGLTDEDWSDLLPAHRVDRSPLKGSHHYHVTATRSDNLWELSVSGVGTTQAETISEADEMIRDLIEILTDTDANDTDFTIEWRINKEIDAEVSAIRSARAEANLRLATINRMAHTASMHMSNLGIEHHDIAIVLDLPHLQVSQLLAKPN